jgi:hypothetical protein
MVLVNIRAKSSRVYHSPEVLFETGLLLLNMLVRTGKTQYPRKLPVGIGRGHEVPSHEGACDRDPYQPSPSIETP